MTAPPTPAHLPPSAASDAPAPRTAPSGRAERLIFLLLIVFYAGYATWFILRSSFWIGNDLYFSLLDDQMISMRYGRNLLAGHGLVWNPGDSPVEGFTNLLWVLLMAVMHLLPIATATMSLAVQVLCAALMLANLVLLRSLGHLLMPGRAAATLAAVFLTATYYPLNRWALLGTEIALLCPLLTAAVISALRNFGSNRSVAPYILLGIGTLVRLDVAVLYLTLWFWFLIADSGNRRSHLIRGGAILFLFLAGQTLFRLAYFHEWLPNTYYLKMSGFPAAYRILKGAAVFFEYLTEGNWLLILFPFIVFCLLPDRSLGLLCALVAAQFAYSIYIGGDAWEYVGGSNRFVGTVMPLFFLALTVSAGRLLSLAQPTLLSRHRFTSWIPAAAAALLVLFAAIDFNETGTRRMLRQAMLFGALEEAEEHRHAVSRALYLGETTTPDAKIAVVWAGIIPYYLERNYHDMLGKNDPQIAHQPMRIDPKRPLAEQFHPGHMKWDYDYSFKLEPDVVAQEWVRDPISEVPNYIRQVYDKHPIWFRQGSPRVLWQNVESDEWAKADTQTTSAQALSSTSPQER